jgi:molybdopterin-guanine dinucleotide biosynthesis protein A
MPTADARDGPAPTLCAAILAGGRASRYGGRNKALLPLDGGASIIEKMLEAVRGAAIDDITIIANDPEPYRDLGLPIVSDLRPERGPLGGIESALHHHAGRCDAVLLLPCDLPDMTVEVIAALRDAFERAAAPVVVAETADGLWHPLCAVVSLDAMGAVGRSLDDGRHGVHRLWRELGALPVHFEDPGPFANINSPADMDRWLGGRSEPSGE